MSRSRRLIRVAALAVLALTLMPAGAANARSPRIIGGSDAAPGEFPFVVALLYAADTTTDSLFCGGSHLDERWVLTAGHCVEGLLPDDIAVIPGAHTLATGGAGPGRIRVRHIRRHPAFNRTTLENDLALLYLDIPVTPTPGFALDGGSVLARLADGDAVTAIGWGATAQPIPGDSRYDVYPAILQKTTLNYLGRTTCNGSSYYRGELQHSVICAGFLAGSPRDTCNGDSGGPLLAKDEHGEWRQVGITSYGWDDNCATVSQPGIYTSVPSFHEFIRDARSRPGLRVTISELQNFGTRATARVRVSNESPVTRATAVELSLGTIYSLHAEDLDRLSGCTRQGPDTARCDLGDIEARGGYRIYDISLRIDGPGRLAATVESPDGDDWTDDNSTSREFGARRPATPLASSGSGGSGGPLVPLALVFLAALAWRRGSLIPRRRFQHR